MKLVVYKGFDREFLQEVKERPLLESSIDSKKNVLQFDKNMRRKLDAALLSLGDDDSVWATYEEFSLIKNRVDDAIAEYDLGVEIFRNNLYPDYYPLEFPLDVSTLNEVAETLNGERSGEQSENCKKIIAVYNNLVGVENTIYGGFYNYEYENETKIQTKDYYPMNMPVQDSDDTCDLTIFLNEDIDTFLRDFEKVKRIQPKRIGLRSTGGDTSRRIQFALQAYCLHNGIQLVRNNEKLQEEIAFENELSDIAKNVIKIKNFSEFRKIAFYKNPDINKDRMEVSQAQIIGEIIHQAEKAYGGFENESSRDIFITASTGAGKSVMFQVPAVYLAQKYGKLTIIIEPVKALMQDQKEKLVSAGYNRVEAFNSDLITQVEKEEVIQRIKAGEVDLLYLSPETLLSYSIETIVGEREIGLVIVDEAHIVTTWGVGFRPDYWYLGVYLNRLRNQIQTNNGIQRQVYRFPVCAFTATAINGGIDDSVSDTIISLYMQNPIKYLGYIRRDDISFDITHFGDGQKMPKDEYEVAKCKALDSRIKGWLANGEKTIVYFPYASLARDASKGQRGFAGITTDKRIGTYTGRNIEELSNEAFNEIKKQTFERFREGTTPIMLATKAFGMGVDVDDVNNVYHYAVSGNLCDYVQEIGRAARKKGLKGKAITDWYYNDMTFMKVLFGMSQIRQYQVKKVLEGIYDTFKSKKEARSFLISPESFTYIFSGHDEECINKLKTCLLMLEKDFYDKYNFKVLISRPQSIFTKAFVCISRDSEEMVMNSEYGRFFSFVARGRSSERQMDGSLLSDGGDIYSIDLKSIWENYYPNISFPMFKYWYFNNNSTANDRVVILPLIREKIHPRQKITVEARRDLLLSELREKILEDFDFIADSLYSEFKKSFFTTEDFAKLIREKYGITKARVIANSLFDLVDPDGRCVKHRSGDSSGRMFYSLAYGNFKELMRKPITSSRIVHNISNEQNSATYTGYISMLDKDNSSNVALKLLSVFDYITYEVMGGEEPEIYIRLNDPNKIRNIVLGNSFYSNNYVTKAKQKHDRDVAILLRFFNDLSEDNQRWDYIEDYFLGYDVLEGAIIDSPKTIKMSKSIDKEHSYQTSMFRSWMDLKAFFDEADHSILEKFNETGVPIPEYLETVIKKSEEGKDILMSWPSKDVLICQQDTSNGTIEYFSRKGWIAYRIYEIDFNKIKEKLS